VRILRALDAILAGIPITYALIGLSVVVSLVGFWALRTPRFRPYFVFVPSKQNRSRSPVGTLLSHFAHGDFGHLFLNLLALYFFGPRVEQALGPTAYLIVYLASGACGTFFVWLFHSKNRRYAALGASGSIAGVLFASVVTAPTASIFLLVFPVAIPAPVFALLYLVLSSVKMGGSDGVAHEAHIGGALAGFALAGLLHARGFEPLIRAVEKLAG
jgi:membrane associated rhomboid family serine protease